jgi:hypothetical protein
VQSLLEAVLFEPLVVGGDAAGGGGGGGANDAVASLVASGTWTAPLSPEHRRAVLATPCGLLWNELLHDPVAVVMPILAQTTRVAALCTGEHDSAFVRLTLFLTRVVVRVHGFVRAARTAVGVRPGVVGAAGSNPSTTLRQSLDACCDAMAALMVQLRTVMAGLVQQAGAKDDTQAACKFHSYCVLLYSHVDSLSEADALALETSAAFVVAWYSPGEGGGAFDPNFVKVGARLCRCRLFDAIVCYCCQCCCCCCGVFSHACCVERRYRCSSTSLCGQRTARSPTFSSATCCQCCNDTGSSSSGSQTRCRPAASTPSCRRCSARRCGSRRRQSRRRGRSCRGR